MKGFKNTEIGMIPEDWDVIPISDITTLMTNGFVGTVKSHYTDYENGILYIQGYNVEENSFNYNGIKRVTEEFHKNHLKSCLQGGDLLTIQTGDIGVTTVVPEHLAGSNCHALIITRFKKGTVEPKFYSYYFNYSAGRRRLKEIETGSTMKHINVGDMIQLMIPYPSLAEQTAIASALNDADALIQKLEQLIAKKCLIKTGAMQELLKPKEGWEVKKLGEVVKVKHGKSQKEVVSENGAYPILASGGIIGRAKSFLYNKPSVLIGRKGTIDEPQYMDKPFWSVDTLFYTEIFEEYEAKFIYYMFNLIDWYSYNEASGVPSLNAKTIELIEKSFPKTKSEQTHIAQILSDMDNEISALEKQLEKYKLIKQGMMQQLLTGKIRLI